MPASLRILYVPVAGGVGSGERLRCEALAAAVLARVPHCQQALVGPTRPAPPVHWLPLAVSPTRDPAGIAAAIDGFGPTWVVFDGNVRRAALHRARACGARVAFIASRPSARRRALSWPRLPFLDAIWLLEPLPQRQQLRWPEGLRWRLRGRGRLQFWSSLHTAPDTDAAAARWHELGLSGGDYLLLCAGGGGQRFQGRSVDDWMIAVAESVAARSGVPVVMVGSDRAQSRAGLAFLPRLPQAELLALAAGARAALLGGGSLLVQALTEGAHCAAVGWQDEQRQRIAGLAAAGLVWPALPRVDAMAAALLAAAAAAAATGEHRTRQRPAGMVNGLPEAAALLTSSVLSTDAHRLAPRSPSALPPGAPAAAARIVHASLTGAGIAQGDPGK